MRAHRKACWGCSKARTDPYAYCDEGWEMAKRASRAAYQLRKFKETSVAGQGVLF